MGVLSRIIGSTDSKQKVSNRGLIKRESIIGGKIFGAIPAGRRREFFCLDQHTWVWFEEWTDADGQLKSVTTRYEVTPHGIVKAQDGLHYQYVHGQEAQTLKVAIAEYYKQVSKQVYGQAVA